MFEYINYNARNTVVSVESVVKNCISLYLVIVSFCRKISLLTKKKL